ncbi:MAG: sigma 54-interacting transcriptional regulator [Candidatus Solibacter sp.]
MEAELIVISGAQLGTRFSLDHGEITLGRATSNTVRLQDAGIAAEHCAIRTLPAACRLTDRRSAGGTYVNGMRVTAHELEPGDQIALGECVLLYREKAAAEGSDARQTLLRACSFLFLFRALAGAQEETQRAALEAPLHTLVEGIVPCTASVVLLGRNPDEWSAAAAHRGGAAELEALAATAFRDGAVADPAAGLVAIPLWTRGEPAGLLAAWFPADELVNLAEHRDTLAALATLAASALDTMRDVERLRNENSLLKERLGAVETGIAGESIAIHKMLNLIARVAPQDTSVLILGETGAGKELVARAVHRLSPRAAHPFIAINCAALTESLLESELFGHEKGAFTGAVAQKKGKLELAEGGTVFLDEIGELAPQLQAKLLRVLQQREFERVGGTRTWKLDVRVVAATNRDLAAEAQRGAFRLDLYHRLNVVTLKVPPLRERCGDIPALAQYFLDRAAPRCGRAVKGISPEAERCLLSYAWPGNVRELENAIERAVVLGDSDYIQPEDLPETVLDSTALSEAPGALQTSVEDTKRQLIAAAWRQCEGDHNRTAAQLHLHPNSLRRLIRTLGLREMLT